MAKETDIIKLRQLANQLEAENKDLKEQIEYCNDFISHLACGRGAPGFQNAPMHVGMQEACRLHGKTLQDGKKPHVEAKKQREKQEADQRKAENDRIAAERDAATAVKKAKKK